MKFLARIYKGKIRIPPTKEFKDGDVVEVAIKPLREEEKEE